MWTTSVINIQESGKSVEVNESREDRMGTIALNWAMEDRQHLDWKLF